MSGIIIDITPVIISTIISIILYKKLDPAWIRLFTWFMILTILISIAGYAYSFYLKKSNHFIFNIYLLVEFLFYFTIFYKTFQTKKQKTLTILVSISFTIFTLLSFLKKDGFYVFNSAAYMLGSVLTIVFCLLYFVSIFKSDVFINYFRIPMFWIATGLLFFFVGNFIYLSFIDYIINNDLDKDGSIYRIIMFTLNLLLYSLFSIGFLSNQPWKKKT